MGSSLSEYLYILTLSLVVCIEISILSLVYNITYPHNKISFHLVFLVTLGLLFIVHIIYFNKAISRKIWNEKFIDSVVHGVDAVFVFVLLGTYHKVYVMVLSPIKDSSSSYFWMILLGLAFLTIILMTGAHYLIKYVLLKQLPTTHKSLINTETVSSAKKNEVCLGEWNKWCNAYGFPVLGGAFISVGLSLIYLELDKPYKLHLGIVIASMGVILLVVGLKIQHNLIRSIS